jgi:hypothetical protein
MAFSEMHTIIKPGQIGQVKIEHVDVSPTLSLRTAVQSHREPPVPPGRYCILTVGSEVMMSDTPMEKRSNREVVFQARGDVLIAGLGIGMVLLPILAKPEVKSVTVVEKSQEIIQLVAPALYQQPGAEKLTIVYKDVFDWRPEEGTKYDTLYFDIWPTIVEDNLDEMDDLHRIFRRYRRKGSWMNSWMRETLKFQQQRRRRQRVF